MTKTFSGNFTQQEAIPENAIARAVEVMRSGRLHRYNVVEGEVSETALLEQEYAAYQGSKFCLACASGGYALHIALRAAGVEVNDPVLTNAFTLSPVPGAIHNAGGKPVLVESDRDLVIDLGDLESKIKYSGSRFLLLSHMRGHLVDMTALCTVLEKHTVTLIEDCAHTMGAMWDGKRSGSFGRVACFSTQTYKHVNSGEGGLLTTDDPELMARAVMLSGSYMLYDRHVAAPAPEIFETIRLENPNYSGRMDNLRAAILRPQLLLLDENVRRWNKRYQIIQHAISGVSGLRQPDRPKYEFYVGSSLQFFIDVLDDGDAQDFLARCKSRGVELKWFGGTEPNAYTSRHDSWHYVEKHSLPRTDDLLDHLFDIRIPLSFSEDDCGLIGSIIAECAEEIIGEIKHRNQTGSSAAE